MELMVLWWFKIAINIMLLTEHPTVNPVRDEMFIDRMRTKNK